MVHIVMCARMIDNCRLLPVLSIRKTGASGGIEKNVNGEDNASPPISMFVSRSLPYVSCTCHHPSPPRKIVNKSEVKMQHPDNLMPLTVIFKSHVYIMFQYENEAGKGLKKRQNLG